MKSDQKLTREEESRVFYDLRQQGVSCQEIARLFRTDAGAVMYSSAQEANRIAAELMTAQVMMDADVVADIERRKVAASLSGALSNLRSVAYVLARTDEVCDKIEAMA